MTRAVFFLLHFPYPHPPRGGNGRWALPTTASCGARTFLSPEARGTRSGRPRGLPENDRPAGLWNLSIIRENPANLSLREGCKRSKLGMVQMRVTPGPQNQAQRTQSVSPIGLVVNGLHCAASHTRLLSSVTLTCQLLNHAHFVSCANHFASWRKPFCARAQTIWTGMPCNKPLPTDTGQAHT